MKPGEIWRYLLHTGPVFYTSLALFTCFLMFQSAIWLAILNDGGRQLSMFKGLYIYNRSQFGKYIPGGFWNYAGRIVMASREGVGMAPQLSAIFYEHVLLILAAAIYSLILLLILKVLPWYGLVLFVIAMGLVYGFYPQVSKGIARGAGWFIRKFKIKNFSAPAKLMTRKSFFLYLGYYLLSHMVMGVAFWLLIRSFDVPSVGLMYAAGTFACAWLLGLLSPLPGGLGIREGFLVYFLSFHMDAATALHISIISRIWNILSEALFFAVMQAVHFTRKRMKVYEA